MYVATSDTVLAFFHFPGEWFVCRINKITSWLTSVQDEVTSSIMLKNSCGDHKRRNMDSNNRFCALTLKESLIEQDKQLSPSLSTSSSLSSIESTQQYQNECDAPHQFLYIIDSQTKSVLLSWPDH